MPIDGRHVLVVEDEYMLALDLRQELEDAGAIVIGPEPSVERALARVASAPRIDAAVLDVNLGDEKSFSVADELRARNIPFIFASGYGDDAVATRFPDVTNCSKPLSIPALLSELEKAMRAA